MAAWSTEVHAQRPKSGLASQLLHPIAPISGLDTQFISESRHKVRNNGNGSIESEPVA